MEKKRAALVLAGGGARGIAHIGAIEELESRGYEIHAVAGTSMGALVGGMYASGNLEPFKEWMYTLDKYKVFHLVDLALSTEGLVKGTRVMNAMKELVPDIGIEQLSLPFVAVAADLLTGHEVVLDHGGLYDAIRASISIPSVFQPVHLEEMVLVDGGTVNPLPLNRVHREPGDVLVGVDVSAPFSAAAKKVKKSLNYYKVLTASSDIMQQHISRLMSALYKPDLLIELPADSFGVFEFYRAKEIVEAGRLATRAALERIGEREQPLLQEQEQELTQALAREQAAVQN
ncbi:patatin-like phospholipase family protein [uncultured Alistipes sp.]|jgi:predicted esterase of the alpha-beta hydrolase superfamily|uniref:patatin-like phospholipase family protein n=1 Tax=uncultured Alistipes sp. TaxID=538949 RepID=UPI0025DD2877|nr:patatin-like phospholipase family protein [uncultured Alistipes sp.]